MANQPVAKDTNSPNRSTNSLPSDEQSPSFEAAYNELGSIVDQLESGQLSLDETLALYERGRQLIQRCEAQLNAAELRVSQLIGDAANGFKVEPLA